MNQSWIILLLAGLCEIGWAILLKQTEHFTRLWPSVLTVFFMITSFALLSFSFKEIPVGTAYAVWTGIGALGTAIYGLAFLNEPTDFIRLFSLFLIITGTIGLRFSFQS